MATVEAAQALVSVGRMFDGYADVVTVKELCQMLKLGRNTAYTLVKSGELASVKIGARYLIPKVYIVAYLQRQSGM